MITASPRTGSRWLLADWLELEALCSQSASAPTHAINGDPLNEPDEQPEDIDEDGVREDDRVSRLTTEVEARVKMLGGAYPFRMTANGARIELHPQTGIGATVYLFCLLASHGRSGGFLHETDVVPMGDVPDLLQACATWSAAGYERGPAYALGLEPTSDAFLPRLREIYHAFGDGTPVAAIPPGAPRMVKDDGVDVIAWQMLPDNRAPASYLLAQVASGNNWRTKTVKAVIQRFHATWFAPAPVRDGKPAMMIPFCLDGGADDCDDEDLEQAALAMTFRRLVAEYGELFYRYTMPHYAELGLKMHADGMHVDMVDWCSRLQDFVSGVIVDLQARCP